MQTSSTWWIAYCFISFIVALIMMLGGIWFLEVPRWTAGYFLMATLLLIASCFSLAKTLRDLHEARRLVHRLDDAKAEQLLRQYDLANASGAAT